MVDVGGKGDTEREAVATGYVKMRPETARLIVTGKIPKGDVLNTARVAAIMAAKKTPEIIPLCHPLLLTYVEVDLTVNDSKGEVFISAVVRCKGKTGVEMEALTAVCAAALTIYDMCKIVDKEMTIADISLKEKRGGKSGEYRRDE